MSSYEFYLSDVTFTNGSDVAQINNSDSVFGAILGSQVFVAGFDLPETLVSVDTENNTMTLSRPWPRLNSESVEVKISPVASIDTLLSAIAALNDVNLSSRDLVDSLASDVETLTNGFLSASLGQVSTREQIRDCVVNVATLKNLVLKGAIKVGEFASTSEYGPDPGEGANNYKICDALTANNRPPEDGGSIIHVGSEGLYLEGLFPGGIIWVAQFGAHNTKGHVDSSAFLNALNYCATKKTDLHIKAKVGHYYTVGAVTVPLGVGLIGHGWKRIYDPQSIDEMEGGCSIVRDTNGIGALTFAGGNSCQHVNLYGVDRTCYGLSDQSAVFGLNFLFVGIYQYRRGFGCAYSVRSSHFGFCRAAKNDFGFYGYVDTYIIACVSNANFIDGIHFQNGHNSNELVGCRLEWNGRYNFLAYSARHLTVTGGTLDRASGPGASIQGSEVSFNGTEFWRNGKEKLNHPINSAEDYCTHIVTGGEDTQLALSNIKTAIGADDGGSGETTPEYVIVAAGDTGAITINGGDLSGSSVAPILYQSKVQALTVRGVAGIDDFDNSGKDQVSNGRTFIGQFGGNVAAGATYTKRLSMRSISEFYTDVNRFEIIIRHGATGLDYAGEIVALFSREQGPTQITFTEVIYATNPDLFSTLINIDAINIAPDGSEFDIRVTNNFSDTIRILGHQK